MASKKGLDEIVVIGGGPIGREIASLASLQGMNVHLYCLAGANSKDVEKAIAAELNEKVSKWTISGSEAKAVISRIVFHQLLEMPPQKTGLVVDTLVLDLDEKIMRACRFDEFFDEDVVIVMNLGGSLLSNFIGKVKHKERFIGARFFQPVWETKCVEVFECSNVAISTYDTMSAFCAKLGRKPVFLPDVAGAVNVRAFIALLIEAMNMLDEGMGSTAEVDELLKDSLGMRIGPLALADIIGLDVVNHWGEALGRNGSARATLHKRLAFYIEQKWLGRESGRGFYSY